MLGKLISNLKKQFDTGGFKKTKENYFLKYK
jgi:hypothetical protein